MEYSYIDEAIWSYILSIGFLKESNLSCASPKVSMIVSKFSSRISLNPSFALCKLEFASLDIMEYSEYQPERNDISGWKLPVFGSSSSWTYLPNRWITSNTHLSL